MELKIYECDVTSGGMTYMSSFMEIEKLFQDIRGDTGTWIL